MPSPAAWRWLAPLTADGATQMAIDQWMLDQLVAERSGPMLRLYRWSRPTLSLGRHQQQLEPHWLELAEAGQIQLVRRPTGGRAVLHAGELTYALVHRLASSNRDAAYRQACHWLQCSFAAAGEPLQFGAGSARDAHQRSNCFASSTRADLVDGRGCKRIGSAQLWRGGCLLQHGSLLLDPPAALWRAVFGAEPPPLRPLAWDGPELERQLQAAAADHLCGGPLLEQPLNAAEQRALESLRAAQLSGLPSMLRATAARAMPNG